MAQPAAMAAMAAGKQGQFWQFHDLIFENYNRLNNEKFQEFAQKLGLDMAKFEKDLTDFESKKQIQMDLQNGFSAGVRGTPTLFVNGRRVKNRSLEGFRQLIDEELKKK